MKTVSSDKYKNMSNYKGVVIEESLESNNVLKRVKIISTKVETVADKHQTPWLKQWTLHTVEVPESQARAVAEEISRSLDYSHKSAWYADYKNDQHHYIIFRDKIFLIDRTNKGQYDEAKRYGISLGIPEYQVDFHPEVKEWER